MMNLSEGVQSEALLYKHILNEGVQIKTLSEIHIEATWRLMVIPIFRSIMSNI